MATITIAMASLPIPVFGNGFFLEKPHLPVNGDCVLKYHYFFQECDQGKAVWDFSHAIPKGESHYMQWINLGDSVFVKIENGMQSNFRIQNDTLYWAGYENPLLRVEDSIAPIMAIKSSSKHNSITSAYHFKGMYCGNNYVGLIGHFAITTGGKGLLILPDDTLSDVMPVLITNKFSVKVSNTPQIDNMVSPPDNLLPYGGLMGAAGSGVQSRKYGGKELDRENGLDWYDSQARHYDPTTGRTPTMDSKAESYYSLSPYLWCAGNPVRNIDPTGEELIVMGSDEARQIYLDMIYNSTGSIYAFDDKNHMFLKNTDLNFRGKSSQTLRTLINSAIDSETEYSFSLTGDLMDDETVFIDSYITKQLDISDLMIIGKTSTALQGALIGHQINEIMVGGDYQTAHDISLKKEGVIYGELVGDHSISSRTDVPTVPDRPLDNIFQYNEEHSYLLQSGGTFTTERIGSKGTTITVIRNGELKKVKKL